MYEEGVKQYFTAKRMAARRLLGKVAGKRMRFLPADLPSNGEIRDALLSLAELAEGGRRLLRLFTMRVLALETMSCLLPFEPRLIGSVSTGHVRRGSDIDIQVFSDHEELLENHLASLSWFFEKENVTIHKGGEFRSYVHFHLRETFPIELTLYPLNDLRHRPRSSTDGKPIVRLTTSALSALLGRDHPEAFQKYLLDRTISGLEEAIRERALEDRGEAKQPGPFDGLLLEESTFEGPESTFSAGLVGEEEDDYDPLPGFEHYGSS